MIFFLDPVSILPLGGPMVPVRSEGMRFSLDSSNHSPTPSSKSVEISSRNLYIGMKGWIAHYLFLSSFTLNGNVINTYIGNRDFERRRRPGNRIRVIKSWEERKTPVSPVKVLTLKSKQRRFRLSLQRSEKEQLVSVNLTEKILTVLKIKIFWKATILSRRRFRY